jgi:hypothetical protein
MSTRTETIVFHNLSSEERAEEYKKRKYDSVKLYLVLGGISVIGLGLLITGVYFAVIDGIKNPVKHAQFTLKVLISMPMANCEEEDQLEANDGVKAGP